MPVRRNVPATARGAGGWDVVAPPNWGRPLWHALVRHACGHAGGRKERRLVDAVAAGEDMDAYLVREGPGRPRREKKRWVPVAKKKKPPAAAGSPRPPPEADGESKS